MPGVTFKINEAIAGLLDHASIEDVEVPFASDAALRGIGTAVENAPGNSAVAQSAGYSALAHSDGAAAYHLFRRAAERRPYEPHHYLAMALALDAAGKDVLAKIWFEVALAAEWNERYRTFREIARVHYVSHLRRHSDPRADEIKGTELPGEADCIVTVLWNTDSTDIDLHVLDPAGEECCYNHNRTAMGGRLTEDVTTGYGPEMFVLRRAAPGPYRAWLSNYREDQNRSGTRTAV